MPNPVCDKCEGSGFFHGIAPEPQRCPACDGFDRVVGELENLRQQLTEVEDAIIPELKSTVTQLQNSQAIADELLKHKTNIITELRSQLEGVERKAKRLKWLEHNLTINMMIHLTGGNLCSSFDEAIDTAMKGGSE